MNRMLSSLLVLAFVVTGNAQNATPKPAEVQSFKAGGTPIVISTPATDMAEVGYDTRERMEVFVSPSNRLLAAFVMTKDIPRLASGPGALVLARYGMVQVPRQGEYMDVETGDFGQIIESVKQEVGGAGVSSSFQAGEEEIQRRLKSMNIDAAVSLGKPVQLGTLFTKKDAYGFGLISPVSVGATAMKMAMGCAVVRVKKRLIFVYLYSEYQNEETITWLRKTTEQWADTMLRQNN